MATRKKPPAKKKAPSKAKKKAPVKTKAPKTAAKKAPAQARKKTRRPKKGPQVHWLVRPETIRKLWIAGGTALAVLVAVELAVYTHGYFAIDGTFAFNAWFGFVACVAMIAGAKGLGVFLNRKDTYYGGD